MSRWAIVAILGAVAASLALPSAAHACSCMRPGPPPCQAFWQADAVFVGRVMAIEDVQSPRDDRFMARRVTFRIMEPFRGVGGDEVEVLTGRGGGDCGYPFDVGQTYLVYGHSGEAGVLSTGICSRTRPLREGGEDVAYARAALEPPSSVAGRIVGAVWGPPRESEPSARARDPMAGVRVEATAGGITRASVSDASGRYEIGGLPTGEYALRAEVPPGLYASGRDRVTVLDLRGCARAEFHASYDGRISGRLVDASGRPIGAATVELWAPERLERSYLGAAARARTDGQGRYELARVPPGRYLLTASLARDGEEESAELRLFHPRVRETEEATPVDVGPGARVPVPDLVVPGPVELVTLSGVVRHPDGSPAAGVEVYLRAEGEGFHLVGLPAVTGSDGRFTHTVVAGARVVVVAELQRREDDAYAMFRSDDWPVVAAGDAPPLELVLRRVR